MSLALVDESGVGKGKVEASAHIIYVAGILRLVVEAGHRALYGVGTEAQRSVRLGVDCKVAWESHVSCVIGIGHPKLVVGSHFCYTRLRYGINVNSCWSAAVGIDIHLVSLTCLEGLGVELCNIGAGICRSRSHVCSDYGGRAYEGDIDSGNLVLLVKTYLDVRIGIGVGVALTISLAPG